MEIEIQALTPELEKAYFDFFDYHAFSDGSPYYPCYCNAFNMSAVEIKELHRQAKTYGGSTDDWKRVLRESAVRMVRAGKICGYLAFEKGVPIGWCNANDRTNYYRVGEFDLDNVPEDKAASDCRKKGEIKSIVCFEISPEYRGKGIATQLLNRVCADAKIEKYNFVEAYPKEQEQYNMLAFTGPIHLYKKAGFIEFSRAGTTIIMRKSVK